MDEQDKVSKQCTNAFPALPLAMARAEGRVTHSCNASSCNQVLGFTPQRRNANDSGLSDTQLSTAKQSCWDCL